MSQYGRRGGVITLPRRGRADYSGSGKRPTIVFSVVVALMLLVDVLMGAGIHEIVKVGTCSSTGYTDYGPAPKCPGGTALAGAFLPIAIIGSIAAAFIVGVNIAIPGLFIGMGAGSLVEGLGNQIGNSGRAFPIVFGGCFVVSGLVWFVIGLVAAGPSGLRADPLRLVGSLALWAIAILGGLAIGSQVHVHVAPASGNGSSTTATTDITTAPLPAPGAGQTISATRSDSLYRPANLGRVLTAMDDRFGSDTNVVALAIYPGQFDAVIVDDAGEARLVTSGTDAELAVGDPQTFNGNRQAVAISQVKPEVLAKLIAQAGGPDGVTDAAIDLKPQLAHWALTLTGGQVREALLTGGRLSAATATSTTPTGPTTHIGNP